MLPIEPWNEIYFPCFYFISSGYAVRRIEFFCLFVAKRIIFGNFFLCFFVFLASSLFLFFFFFF